MIERETIRRTKDVSFYFDPICPWTWITSRWLLDVADERSLHIHWRTMSLAILNGGVEGMPAQYRAPAQFSMCMLRMIEAMRAAGRDDLIGPFFTVVGTRLHVLHERPDRELLESASREAGVTGFLVAADDEYWDEAIEESTDEAMELGGPDVGSPILHVRGFEKGLHGPIVSPAPTGDAAIRLWDAIEAALEVPEFFEIKHGRTGAPQIEPAQIEQAASAG
jgi:2-hydroxychromene-2-carboxylate isomerase